MIWIKVSGGKDTQRKLVKKVIKWAAYRLHHKRMADNLEIEVTLKKKLDGNLEGLCTWEDHNIRPREFSIEIKRDMPRKNLILTALHEMVHVKQFAKEELKDRFKGGYMQLWKGKEYKVAYNDEPWELEAYNMQEILYDEYIKRKR